MGGAGDVEAGAEGVALDKERAGAGEGAGAEGGMEVDE